ncbi:hypothetical protein QJQ45_027182 [Haematococcus lacustris]|nr:hypothetical protein QJQ45_027182 [Haematococcus lacustris]
MDPIAVGVLLLCVLFTSCSSAFGQGVSVSLRATWPSTPYIAEAAELLADDDPQLFWTFAELAMGASEPTEHVRCWAHITNLTTETMKDSPGVSQVAPLALASRQYSAKVEMLRQLHSQLHPGTQARACCMVDLAGQTFTSATDLKRGLEAAASMNSTGGAGAQLFEFDHVMESGQPMQAGRSPPVAVLYAPLGSAACTAELHAELAAAARKGQLAYAWRPVLGAACQASGSGQARDITGSVWCAHQQQQQGQHHHQQQQLVLQEQQDQWKQQAPQVGPCASLGAEEVVLLLPGWGVEAVLKNTEYSAMDDKDRKAAEAAAGAKAAGGKGGGDGGGEEGAAVEVLGEQAGFLFDTLVQRLPSARQELLTFRDHLLSSDEEEAVKVWDLKDMGLQATQRIMQAADPLALLTELSQNFPSLVSSLSRQKVNESLRAAVAHNQQFMSPGGNFMLINGLSFDINNFDLFGLLDRLRQELKVSSALSKLGLPPPEVTQLLQLRAEVSGEALSSARLDMGLGPGGRGQAHVLWLNDLQRDSQYTSRFSTHLTDLLHAFPGRLRPLALNLFNLVLVLDPTSGAGLATAELVAEDGELLAA